MSIALKYLKNKLNRPENANLYDWWAEFEGSPVKWYVNIGIFFFFLPNPYFNNKATT